MNSLPIDLFFHIAYYLPTQDYLCFKATSSRFYELNYRPKVSDRVFKTSLQWLVKQKKTLKPCDLPILDVYSVSKPETVLLLLTREEHLTTLQHFINDPNTKFNFQSDYMIRFMALNNRHSAMKLLVQDTRIDPNAARGEPMQFAIMNGNTTFAEYLMNHPLYQPRLIAFELACRCKQWRIATRLLEHTRFDWADCFERLFELACQHHQPEWIKLLASWSKCIDPLVHLAIQFGNEMALGLLLNACLIRSSIDNSLTFKTNESFKHFDVQNDQVFGQPNQLHDPKACFDAIIATGNVRLGFTFIESKVFSSVPLDYALVQARQHGLFWLMDRLIEQV